MNIALVADEAAGIQMLRVLEALDHPIVAVLARAPGPVGSASSVWTGAQQHGHRPWPVEHVQDGDFAGVLRQLDVDVLLNVHSLLVIAPPVLEAPRHGCFNLHPGPLPRYAGLNAVSWAIYQGEATHGVTVHRMVPRLDAGPIAYQRTFPIGPADSALTVSATCVRLGVDLMRQLVEDCARDPASVPAIEQDPRQRTFFGRGAPAEGRLRWKQPAVRVLDFIRACDYVPLPSPWGHPRARYRGQEIGIVKAAATLTPAQEPPGAIGAADGPGLRVACGDDWIVISRVQVGGRYAPAADVLEPGGRLDDG